MRPKKKRPYYNKKHPNPLSAYKCEVCGRRSTHCNYKKLLCEDCYSEEVGEARKERLRNRR